MVLNCFTTETTSISLPTLTRKNRSIQTIPKIQNVNESYILIGAIVARRPHEVAVIRGMPINHDPMKDIEL